LLESTNNYVLMADVEKMFSDVVTRERSMLLENILAGKRKTSKRSNSIRLHSIFLQHHFWLFAEIRE